MAFRKFFHFWLCFVVILALVMYDVRLKQLWFAISTFFAIIPLASWLMSFSRKYVLNPHLSSEGKAVLITGCDTGIGHLLARRLDELKYHVFAGCLNIQGEGAKFLENSSSERLKVFPLDVTSDESVQASLEFVKENLNFNVLWAVVNNAGVAQAGEIEWTPMEEFKKAHEVNAYGLVRITKAFLPLLRRSKGRVVNNTSFCAHLTFPGFVGYCMSKLAAASFTTGLRIEMVKWDVKSISIEAFFYKTPLTERDSNLKLIQSTWDKAPEDVKAAYGDHYIAAFKDSCKRLVKRGSNHVSEYIYCFEDALGSKDPLNSYFPCYFPHKVALSLFVILPRFIGETYQRLQLAYFTKPADLYLETKETALTENTQIYSKDGSFVEVAADGTLYEYEILYEKNDIDQSTTYFPDF